MTTHEAQVEGERSSDYWLAKLRLKRNFARDGMLMNSEDWGLKIEKLGL